MSPCLGVKLLNGDSYLLEPMAFAQDFVKVDHDGVTMSKAGWIELKEDTPSENLLDIYTEGFKKVNQYLVKLRTAKSKKRKSANTDEDNKSKTPKESEATSIGKNNCENLEQEKLSLIPLEAKETGEASTRHYNPFTSNRCRQRLNSRA